MSFKTVMIGYADPDSVPRELRWREYFPRAQFQVLVMELDLDPGEELYTPRMIADQAFIASNSEEVFHTRARAQMQREMRTLQPHSLSVGDYVEFDGHRLACAKMGWKEVEISG